MQDEHEAGQLNAALIEKLKTEGFLAAPTIEQAFRSVLRHHFLPGRPWHEVYANEAIVTHRDPEHGMPISSSSEPAAMALMLTQLRVQPGMRVLEIGTGTGYNAALLAELTGNADLVWTLDLDADICEEARLHLMAAGTTGIHILCTDGWNGYPEAAPYDRIIITASAYDLSPAWFAQLREGGRIVLPWSRLTTAQRGMAFLKHGDRLVLADNVYYGFMPMRGEYGQPPQLTDESGFAWRSDRLTATDLTRLSRLVEQPPTVHACPALPEPVDRIDDLLFFIAVQDARTIARQRMVSEREIEFRIGLADVEQSALCLMVNGSPALLQSWGDGALADELLQHIQRWVDLGRPTPQRVQLTAYLIGAAPTPGADERLLRRRWFDYLVSWTPSYDDD